MIEQKLHATMSGECDPDSSWYATSYNGYPFSSRIYKCVPFFHLVDEEASAKLHANQEQERKKEEARLQRDKDLVWALRTKILTTGEMQEVQERGVSLLHYQDNKEQGFNELLLQQLRIRLMIEKGCKQ